MPQEISIFGKKDGRNLPNSPENPVYIKITGGDLPNQSGTSLTEEQAEALKNLTKLQEKISKLENGEIGQKEGLKKVRVRYFAGKGEKKPTAVTNQANNTGTFTNSTNYQYAGKKVTAVGFITHTAGEIELRIAEQATPLSFTSAGRITLKEGEGMKWYPVDIDVPAGKWLAVKCETGFFKYASVTTTDIGGNGFLTITNGFPTSPSGGSSSYLGFGVEVEETIDTSKPYAGKLFAVIGDSISTYKDWYITP